MTNSMRTYKAIEIQKISVSTQEERYLLSCNGSYYEVNYPIVELVKTLQDYPNETEAISHYIKNKEGKYTYNQVIHLIHKLIQPLLSNNTQKKQTFLYEKELLSSTYINKFSNAFKFLFRKAYIWSFLIIVLLLDIHFFISSENLLLFNRSINVYTIVGMLVFMLSSSFFHELGHASACRYFNVQHGGIGFGLYLNFPVLYTNVSEIWKLERAQRCIVNIAGVYFQCYLLGILLIVFMFTGNDILRYLIFIMNLGFIMTLNPFFKFDGYWIASDLLGVPNLRARSRELIIYCYKRIRKHPITKVPYLLQIRPAAKYGLLVYSIVVNLFMGFYFFYIIPNFLYKFIRTFPDAINELILYLSNNMTPPFALLRNIGSQLLFLALIGYMLWKLVQPLIKRYVTK